MGLETATYINQLNPLNPSDTTDYISGGDDHLRLIKSTIQSTFPRITGPVPVTQDDLSKAEYLVDTGVANGIIVTPVTAWSSYTAGKGFFVKIIATNTGGVTAKVGTLAPVSVLDNGGNGLNAGTLIAGSIHQLVFDGTNFRVDTNNSITRNSQITLNPLSSVNAAIANTRTGTLTLGTNGLSNIVLNSDGSTTFYNGAIAATTAQITTITATNINASGTITVPTITSSGVISTTGGSITVQNANPAFNLRDTNHRSVSLYADSGHFYLLRANGNDSVTSELPASGFWGFDHDIDLGKTTFGNDITVKGDVIIHRLSDPTRGRIYLGNSGTKYIEYAGNHYWCGGADGLVVRGKYVVGKNDEYFDDDYYLPKFLGKFTGLNSTQTWTGSTNGSVPTAVRNSAGNYTLTFPGLTTIYNVQLQGSDSNSSAFCTVRTITSNSFVATVQNSGGTSLDPDIALFVQVYGA